MSLKPINSPISSIKPIDNSPVSPVYQPVGITVVGNEYTKGETVYKKGETVITGEPIQTEETAVEEAQNIIAPLTSAQIQEKAVAKLDYNLSTTHYEKAWKKLVTDAHHIYKIAGLFKYIWQTITASTERKLYASTVEDYNAKALAVVQAVAARHLDASEQKKIADENGIEGSSFVHLTLSADAADEEASKVKIVNKALKEFYAVFKKRCEQLHITDNFDLAILAAEKKLKDIAKSQQFLSNLSEQQIKLAPTLSEKLTTTIGLFDNNVYADVIQSVASKPVETLTPGSYENDLSRLEKQFPKKNVQSDLDKAIAENHKEALEALAEKYRTNDKTVIEPIRTRLQAKLAAEEKALQAEVAALRGTDDRKGEIQLASENLEKCKREEKQTKRGVLELLDRDTINPEKCLSENLLYALDRQIEINSSIKQPAIHFKNMLTSQLKARKEAEQKYFDLVERFNEIGSNWHGVTGHPQDGKLAKVRADLVNLNRRVRQDAVSLADFYTDLSKGGESSKDKIYSEPLLHEADENYYRNQLSDMSLGEYLI